MYPSIIVFALVQKRYLPVFSRICFAVAGRPVYSITHAPRGIISPANMPRPARDRFTSNIKSRGVNERRISSVLEAPKAYDRLAGNLLFFKRVVIQGDRGDHHKGDFDHVPSDDDFANVGWSQDAPEGNRKEYDCIRDLRECIAYIRAKPEVLTGVDAFQMIVNIYVEALAERIGNQTGGRDPEGRGESARERVVVQGSGLGTLQGKTNTQEDRKTNNAYETNPNRSNAFASAVSFNQKVRGEKYRRIENIASVCLKPKEFDRLAANDRDQNEEDDYRAVQPLSVEFPRDQDESAGQ